jgi:probable rRNA maturation factor
MTNNGDFQGDIRVNSPLWDKVTHREEKIRTAVAAALQEVAPSLKAYDVSILLTDDKEMRHFNKMYRDKDKSTNVLSFPQQEPFFFKKKKEDPYGPILLGDILVAYETVEEESNLQKKELTDHLTHLVVHATLHLLGYDHETEEEAVTMESLEVQILKKLFILNPYERGAQNTL